MYHLLIIFFPSYNFFVVFINISIILHKEPGGVLVFLPGQDDIEALQSLLEDNLPGIVGQQYPEDISILGRNQEFKNSLCQNESKNDDEKSNKLDLQDCKEDSIVVGKKGLLVDFEIRPLYAAMPPEEQVRYDILFILLFIYLSIYICFYG